MFEQKVKDLLEEFLQIRKDIFVIKLSVSNNNDIEVLIDGDNGVTVQDCLDASRSIENNLDREEEDFSLRVGSYGLGSPLLMPRQYKKNIDKNLEVISNDVTFKGKLTHADEEKIILTYKERVPKKIGKGKQTIEIIKEFKYTEIMKAINTITFK